MFLTFEDVVKIGDFGLAISIEKHSRLSAESKSATLCGTPNYIAPEVLMKKGHYKQSDFWAIGCMTYALLIGHPPFETESLKQTYERILGNIYTFPNNISEEAQTFIRKLLHPDPHDRGNLDGASTDSIFSQKFLKQTTSQQPTINQIAQQKFHFFLLQTADMITGGKVSMTDLKGSKRAYVKKWIDYSNKFGFGYQMNDNTIGVIFNDGMRIKNQNDNSNKVTAVIDGSVQAKQYEGHVPKEYYARKKLLHHFKQYMEENLADSIPKDPMPKCTKQNFIIGEDQTRKKIFCTSKVT